MDLESDWGSTPSFTWVDAREGVAQPETPIYDKLSIEEMRKEYHEYCPKSKSNNIVFCPEKIIKRKQDKKVQWINDYFKNLEKKSKKKKTKKKSKGKRSKKKKTKRGNKKTKRRNKKTKREKKKTKREKKKTKREKKKTKKEKKEIKRKHRQRRNFMSYVSLLKLFSNLL